MVHMSSGYAALIAAVYLGRSVRHPKDMEGGMFTEIKEPANVPIVMLGTALLWMGWFGVSKHRGCAVSCLQGNRDTILGLCMSSRMDSALCSCVDGGQHMCTSVGHHAELHSA